MTPTQNRTNEPIWRQRWDVCDSCGTATTVSNIDSPDGVPDPEEWDSFPGCMVCGGSLTMGNADDETTDDVWRGRRRAAGEALQRVRALAAKAAPCSIIDGCDAHRLVRVDHLLAAIDGDGTK